MADNDNTTQFPYKHLAVIGVEKLKKYVPPPPPVDTARTSSPRMDSASPHTDSAAESQRRSAEK